jgi:DNA-binding IclR family transcriptional regulator
VRSIDRALKVLACFSFQHQRLNLGDFARKTALSKPTLFRILQTLELNRFVAYDAESSRYSLGLKSLELGRIAFSGFSLNTVAGPFLDTLVSEGRSRVALAVLSDGEVVHVDERRGPDFVPLTGTEIGQRRSPHRGAHGMLLMAYVTDAEVDDLLHKHPLLKRASRSVTDRKEFKRKLKEVRERGYAFEESEVVEGRMAAAAPVRDHMGRVIASVGASAPCGPRNSSEQKEKLIRAVMDAGKKISEALGYGH